MSFSQFCRLYATSLTGKLVLYWSNIWNTFDMAMLLFAVIANVLKNFDESFWVALKSSCQDAVLTIGTYNYSWDELSSTQTLHLSWSSGSGSIMPAGAWDQN